MEEAQGKNRIIMSITREIEKQVGETIESLKLIVKGDRVLIGLSGGPDSVALSLILRKLRKSLGVTLAAAYINHMLRPRAAKKEESFCRELCARLKIDFFSRKIPIPVLAKKDKTGIEECARNYRYEALEEIAGQYGANKIALGHHRDDRVETILFNLFRGAGRNGIIGFRAMRGPIIRPLYDVGREAIDAYLAEHNEPFLIDRSNTTNAYTRNRLRNKIIPRIRQDIHDDAPANILRFATLVGDEERFLTEYVADAYRKLHSVTPGGKNRLDLNYEKAYDIWFVRRLIFRLLEDAGVQEIAFSGIDRLVEMTRARKSGRMQLASRMYAECVGGVLYVYRPGLKIDRYPVRLNGVTEMSYPRVRLTARFCDDISADEIRQTPEQVAFVDADKLAEPIEVGGLQRGARIHPFGRPGSKKVGDFLTDRKYPRPLRDELPVVYDRNGVVWLAGIEIDNRVAVTNETRKIVKIEIGKLTTQD